MPLKLRKRMINSPLCAGSRSPENLGFGHFTRCCFAAGDGKEMYQIVWRTCIDCFFSLKLLFCGVLVAVAVAVVVTILIY